MLNILAARGQLQNLTLNVNFIIANLGNNWFPWMKMYRKTHNSLIKNGQPQIISWFAVNVLNNVSKM